MVVGPEAHLEKAQSVFPLGKLNAPGAVATLL